MDNILYLSKTPYISRTLLYAILPISCANCHMCWSHQGRVVMLLGKNCLLNHKCCGLGFYSTCRILFLTSKIPKSQSPHEVLAVSQSPHRVELKWLCLLRADFLSHIWWTWGFQLKKLHISVFEVLNISSQTIKFKSNSGVDIARSPRYWMSLWLWMKPSLISRLWLDWMACLTKQLNLTCKPEKLS